MNIINILLKGKEKTLRTADFILEETAEISKELKSLVEKLLVQQSVYFSVEKATYTQKASTIQGIRFNLNEIYARYEKLQHQADDVAERASELYTFTRKQAFRVDTTTLSKTEKDKIADALTAVDMMAAEFVNTNAHLDAMNRIVNPEGTTF